MSEETRVSDLKGVPKRVILTAPERVYPTTLIAYADLIVQDGMVVKDRHGMTREASPEDLASCKTLTPAEAKVAVDAAAWRGQPPAEGTRRAIVLESIKKGDVLSDAEALEIADTVELALLGSGDDEREADAQEAIAAVGESLDRIDAPQAPTFAQRGDRLYREMREKLDVADVRSRIDKGRLVDFDRVHNLLDGWEIRRTTDEDATRSLYDRTRELIERLRRTEEDLDTEQHRVASHVRDDRWLSEVVYQAVGAGTRPLLEDNPGYVFPAERVRDAVAALLEEFGIPRACHDCQEEQLEHGYASAAPDEDRDHAATEESAEDALRRVYGEREEARAGESRFAEERDCAFALLRWLLPVTVAKRLDGPEEVG